MRRLFSLGMILWLVGCGDSDGTGAAASGGAAAGGGPEGGAPLGGGSSVSCADLCPDVVAADCPAGPPSVAECENGCETILAGPCASDYDLVYVCAGDAPTYACSASGQASIVGCEMELETLYACLAGG
jgi:hypothetical protein